MKYSNICSEALQPCCIIFKSIYFREYDFQVYFILENVIFESIYFILENIISILFILENIIFNFIHFREYNFQFYSF